MRLSSLVFTAVLCAALLHAVWNALVKGGADKRVNMACVVIGHTPAALIVLCLVPLPAFASWPYLIGGMLCHFGYQVFLLNAYNKGDLSQVYPIARGSAPLIVAAVSVFGLGVVLAPLELLAVAIIALGLMSMALVRQSDGTRNLPAARLALITGCFIASYSLIDGLGARVSGSPWGFYGLLGVLNAIVFTAYLAMTTPQVLRRTFTSGLRIFFIGGTASFVAYSLVIWAFTQAPIALVTALRETSIVFALLIGVFFFRERMDLPKLIATFATLSGAALLRFARI
ncbi:EamA family transporter [Sulfitobacter sp. MF3-043]|uniref:EamA family transporter n=1 Tax=Sulfitobacter sediminivivens TaxID=3252902 RepID=UPI003EB96018